MIVTAASSVLREEGERLSGSARHKKERGGKEVMRP